MQEARAADQSPAILEQFPLPRRRQLREVVDDQTSLGSAGSLPGDVQQGLEGNGARFGSFRREGFLQTRGIFVALLSAWIRQA